MRFERSKTSSSSSKVVYPRLRRRRRTAVFFEVVRVLFLLLLLPMMPERERERERERCRDKTRRPFFCQKKCGTNVVKAFFFQFQNAFIYGHTKPLLVFSIILKTSAINYSMEFIETVSILIKVFGRFSQKV